jgi:hypothetical protein
LMLLHVIVQTLWISASNVPAATNRHRALSISYIASNIIAVVLSALLLPSLGLNAIPLSFIAADLIACVHFVIRDACRIVSMPYPGYMVKTVTGCGVMAGAILGAAYALRAAIPAAFPRLAGLALLLPPIAASVAWFSLLNSQDREQFAAWKDKLVLRRSAGETAR